MSVRFLRFNVFSAVRQRDASLERLLARADPLGAADWRTLAYERLAPATPPPAVAALSPFTGDGPFARAAVGIASPVHYVAELSNVRLPVGGLLTLEVPEAERLAADFNRLWSDAGAHLHPAGGALVVAFDTAMDVRSTDPERALGRHLADFMPKGRDGARLRRLMSEIEMWLHEHPVNLARKAHGQLPVSGLWLWGLGAPLQERPQAAIASSGADPGFDVYAVRDAEDANLLITRASPGDSEWQLKVAPWLESAADLVLSAGEASFGLNGRARLRFWRRARPWWQYFE